MIKKFHLIFIFHLCLLYTSCSQSQVSSDPITHLSENFDENMPFYYGIPKQLSSVDTSPGWELAGQKLKLTGTIYQNDGVTPAPNILLYYYQTDLEGRYSVVKNHPRNMPRNRLGQTHGYIRGWMKSDENGQYTLYTVRPGSYPNRKEPAHIHVTVKEDNIESPYYLDDFVFDDDPLLTTDTRQKMTNRGGSGIVRLAEKNGMMIAERDIILGRNIPDYPITKHNLPKSGKQVGEDISSFTPFHAYGPDKGSKTCPVCKYGWYQGVLYFVGDQVIWEDVKKWLVFFEKESEQRAGLLKVYFVYGNEMDYDRGSSMKILEHMGETLGLKHTALTFISSFTDEISGILLNNIDPRLENTFIIYKRSRVIGNWVDLKPTDENMRKILLVLDSHDNEVLRLPPNKHK